MKPRDLALALIVVVAWGVNFVVVKVGVTITGWLIDVTGTYTAAFALAAGMHVP